MSFKVVVSEVNPLQELGAPPVEIEIFRQSVDVLNLHAVIAAVNQRPRKPRAPNQAKGEKK